MAIRSVDVASFILKHKGEMTTMKLQKLVFYSHVWSLVLDGRPLIREEFQAWRDGPVEPNLFNTHKGNYQVFAIPDGNPDNLDSIAQDRVIQTLETYGRRSAEFLSDLTHREEPWLHARGNYDTTASSTNKITNDAIVEFYSKQPTQHFEIDPSMKLSSIEEGKLSLLRKILQSSHTDHLSESARRVELSKQIGSSLRIEGVEKSNDDILKVIDG